MSATGVTGRFLALLALTLGILACSGDDHAHGHVHPRRSVEGERGLISPPTRPLTWGDVNFIHTTDTHGWLMGHQKLSPPEPNYSGTLGSFASFVEHMKKIAVKKNVDLLVIDSGDLHDGNGLTDGGPPGSVDGHDAVQVLSKVPYDVMAIGNHELYIYAITLDIHQNFAPKLNGRYLSSNANITIVDESGKNTSVPVGDQFVKFKTRLGRKVTALGVIFDFTGNDENTTVQKVEDMVKEAWFNEAIKEEPDFFLLAGHMPVQKDKWPLVFNAIRATHPLTPIVIFGGHTHIRDCVQLDDRSMALESGRYLETVGWMSMELEKSRNNNGGPVEFSRRYLDPNNVTYAFHTGVKAAFSQTTLGKDIDQGLNDIVKKFDLSQQFGVAPQDYLQHGAPFPSNSSLLSLLADQVLPIGLAQGNNRSDIPNIIITNSGSLRFDLYKGPFTKNDQLIVSPFNNTFRFIPNVPFSVAKQVPDEINRSGQDVKKRNMIWEEELVKKGYVDEIYHSWVREMYEREIYDSVRELELEEREVEGKKNATVGYVTKDSCSDVGDDTLHTPIPSFTLPNFVASPNPNVSDDTPIDLVFSDFVESDILRIVSSFWNKTVTSDDVQSYTDIASNSVFESFAKAAWN